MRKIIPIFLLLLSWSFARIEDRCVLASSAVGKELEPDYLNGQILREKMTPDMKLSQIDGCVNTINQRIINLLFKLKSLNTNDTLELPVIGPSVDENQENVEG